MFFYCKKMIKYGLGRMIKKVNFKSNFGRLYGVIYLVYSTLFNFDHILVYHKMIRMQVLNYRNVISIKSKIWNFKPQTHKHWLILNLHF